MLAAVRKWIRSASPAEFIAVAVAVFFPLLSVFQGLDVTDFGFLAVKYRDALSDMAGSGLPQEAGGVWPMAAFYLTEQIGAVGQAVFGSLGVFSFKLMFVFLTWATQLTVFFALRERVSRRMLLSGIALATLAIAPEMQWLNYNNVSGLFYALAGLFLLGAVDGQRRSRWFLAGFFLCLTAFARIPNIVGVLLLIVPFIHAWRVHGARFAGTRMLFATGGFLSGLAVMAGLIFALGQDVVFVDGVRTVFGGSTGEAHQLSSLVKRIFVDLAKVSGTVLVLWLFFAAFRRFVRQGSWARTCVPVLAVLVLVHAPMLCVELALGKTIISFPLYILSVALFLGLVALRALPRPWLLQARTYQLLVVFGIALLVPQGSDRGLWNSVYGLWLVIPLVLGMVFRPGLALDGVRSRLVASPRALYRAILVPAWIFAGMFALTFVYRDGVNRLELTHGLDHPKLAFIHTNGERAAVINELTAWLARYDLAHRPLLAFPGVPLFVYLTDSIPYLGIAWPTLLPVNGQEFAFRWARQRYREYPLVIRNFAVTTARNWPGRDPGMFVPSKGEDRRANLARLTDGLMAEGRYRKVWHNACFEVWEPDGYRRGKE